MKQSLSSKEARALLLYDPETGVLVWRARTPDSFCASATRSAEHICALWNSKHAGKRAGHLSPVSGYVVIRLNGFLYFAHRLAWLIETGAWPAHGVDHKDRDKTNNARVNLREATQRQNLQNQMKKKKGAVGLKGVTRRENGRYVAQINIDGRVTNLGTHDCPAVAHFAYAIASAKYHGEFGRTA